MNPNSILMDIKMDETGEPILSDTGDLDYVYNLDALLQSIMFRMKTYRGDFILQPQCGASLEKFIGEPNSPITGSNIEDSVRYALFHDGVLPEDNISIDVYPTSINTIVVDILVTFNLEESSLIYTLDLRQGLVVTSS